MGLRVQPPGQRTAKHAPPKSWPDCLLTTVSPDQLDFDLGAWGNIPNIVSPVTGEEEVRPSLGYAFRPTEENMRRWRGWWKIANREQFLTFFLLGLLSLIALSVLANSTIGIQPDIGEDLNFLRDESGVLRSVVAPWFATFFLAAAAIKLFATNFGILDYVSRITADPMKVGFLARSNFWSESKIYATVVWVMIAIGSVIIFSGIEPLVLLIIASSGGGIVMAFYSVLLIILNRRALPEQIRLRGFRLAAIVF